MLNNMIDCFIEEIFGNVCVKFYFIFDLYNVIFVFVIFI